jgi:hypothetical protein
MHVVSRIISDNVLTRRKRKLQKVWRYVRPSSYGGPPSVALALRWQKNETQYRRNCTVTLP